MTEKEEEKTKMGDLEKTETNSLEKLGKRVAGTEQQAKQLVQRALAVLGFRVVHESWGMCIETVDGECDVFFEMLPAFSTSWSSILGKLVACREFWIETREDLVPNRIEVANMWTSNPLFGCESIEEVEMKLDLLS